MELTTPSMSKTTSSTQGKSTVKSFELSDLSRDNGFKLFTVTFDLAGEKVNKFSAAVMADFETLIAELEKKGQAGEIEALIFRSGKVGNFIAGADINLIQATATATVGERTALQAEVTLSGGLVS